MVIRIVSVLLAVMTVRAYAQPNAQPSSADILLKGGSVIDGSGIVAIAADVALTGDKITAVGTDLEIAAAWTIDCSGLVICPGFIDLHNHSDAPITKASTRAAANFLTQGCTTIVTGNCGSGPVDTGDYYEKIDRFGAGLNVAHLIPQGSLRERVLGAENVSPSDEQLEEMRQLADLAMRDGAWGMSTGLIYVPSSYADTAELTELAKIVGRYNGLYASHIRGEGTGVLKSVDEAMRIGRGAGVPVHISHFKSSGRDAWGLVREAARMIAQERASGRTVTADQYPYIASSTSLGATLLPSSARAGGNSKLRNRLNDEETAPKLKAIIERALQKREGGHAIQIASYGPQPKWIGMRLSEIAESENRPVADIAVEMLKAGGARIVNFSMNEDDVRHIMAIDWVATASDGRAWLPSAERPHPRNYGTFPRKLGHYAIRNNVISLPAAVRSMTSLPAEILRMKDRGLVKTGLIADVTVFDPVTLKDNATFTDPHQYCSGIQYVFVNGVPAVSRGRVTGALAGKALRYNSDEQDH